MGWQVLRAAEPDDVDNILRWRNQSANREVSTYRHLISEAEHAAWWERTAADPTRRVLIFEEEARPRGVVNFFDLDIAGAERSGSWGFFLDNESAVAEGTALMLWVRIMADAVDYAFDELGLDVLEGEVLEHNEVVRLMNRRFRFTEGDREERLVDGRTIAVIPISLRRSDRRVRRSR